MEYSVCPYKSVQSVHCPNKLLLNSKTKLDAYIWYIFCMFRICLLLSRVTVIYNLCTTDATMEPCQRIPPKVLLQHK